MFILKIVHGVYKIDLPRSYDDEDIDSIVAAYWHETR